jgi:hypothetical protein
MKIELTKEELEKLYKDPPNHPEQETDFQRAYRMGRNRLVLELIEKNKKYKEITNKISPV